MKSSVIFVGIPQRIFAVIALLSLLFSPFGNLVPVASSAPKDEVTVDYCHAPSGDLDKAQKHLDEPESAWNGHKGHDGDFIILTQDDENLCDAIVLLRQCADREDNDADSLIDSDDPGCWTNVLDPGTYDPFDDSESHIPPVLGCMDPDATNYDPAATHGDDSCEYAPTPVPGCTDETALNYDSDATVDDGSCEYPPLPVFGCTDPTATNYDPDATVNDGSCEYPDPGPDPIPGCTDPTATNYDPDATVNDGSCEFPPTPVPGCMDPDATNYNEDATVSDGSCEYPEESIFGCMDDTATNYNPSATEDDGSCVYPEPDVCEDETALNYGEEAECVYPEPEICEDESALNFGEEGECVYPEPVIGCMDPEASNYDEAATEDTEPTACVYPEPEPVFGCMDEDALNYNESATEDNGSCSYYGTITIDKEVIGEGANENQIFSFGAWLPDPTFMSANSAPVTFTADEPSLDVNGYFISEFNLPSRWSLESIACVNNAEPEAEVNATREGDGVRVFIEPDENIDCTFTNRFTPVDSSGDSEHIVIKKIVTDGSDTTQTFNFDVSWSETDVTLIHNTESVSDDLLAGETYTITEGDLPGGWNLINLGCVSSDTEREVFDNPEVPFMLNDDETITCTYTNDQDRYIIFGNIWEDADGDGEVDEGEAGLSGRTVRATNQNDENEVITSESNESGAWELNVPQGTWLITQDVPGGWEHTGEESYLVTVPGPEHLEEEEEQGLVARIMNFFIPTAYAAIIQPSVGPLNFGNKLIPVNTGGGGGGGGGGGSSSGSSSNTTVTAPAPVGDVLGAATSVIPQGAPNTGGGGTSPLVIDLPVLRAILGQGGSIVRKAKKSKKNARKS